MNAALASLAPTCALPPRLLDASQVINFKIVLQLPRAASDRVAVVPDQSVADVADAAAPATATCSNQSSEALVRHRMPSTCLRHRMPSTCSGMTPQAIVAAIGKLWVVIYHSMVVSKPSLTALFVAVLLLCPVDGSCTNTCSDNYDGGVSRDNSFIIPFSDPFNSCALE